MNHPLKHKNETDRKTGRIKEDYGTNRDKRQNEEEKEKHQQ